MIEQGGYVHEADEANFNGYNIGVVNQTEYKRDEYRWFTEFSAYAIPADKTIAPVNSEWLSDNFGGYDTHDKTVFLRHIIEVDYGLLDKGHTAVEVVWS